MDKGREERVHILQTPSLAHFACQFLSPFSPTAVSLVPGFYSNQYKLLHVQPCYSQEQKKKSLSIRT